MSDKELKADSRLWLYVANRELSQSEINFIELNGKDFVQNWAAHGAKLNAEVEVLHNLFVVIMADEDEVKASGCSIDSSVHWIKSVGEELNVDFFNRLNVPFKAENGEVELKSLQEIEADYNSGNLNDESTVFNTAITRKRDLEDNFEIPLKDSWVHRRVLA